MRRVIGALWGIMISRNLAVVLLIVVTLMLGAGAVLPNPALLGPAGSEAMRAKHPVAFWLGERYNSQKLASGYLFGSIGIFLILSTGLCSVDRLVSRYRMRGRRRYALPAVGSNRGLRFVLHEVEQSELSGHVRLWLKQRRWSVVDVDREEGKSAVAGIRGNIGFWGSVFFHAVLITALVGMVVYYLAAYRARLGFTEGQFYRLSKENFVSVEAEPLWGFRFPPVEIGLLKQESVYSADDPWYPLDYSARFRVRDIPSGKSWEKTVRINDPLVIDGLELLMVVGGFSPRVVIRNAFGHTVFDSFVSLRNDRGTEDGFLVGAEGLSVEAKLYPDYRRGAEGHRTESLQLKNPVLHLRVSRDGAPFADVFVPKGGSAESGGYTFVFPDVRKWVELNLVGEPGIGFFFWISLAGLAGLLVRMLDPDERLYVIMAREGTGVEVEVLPYSRHFTGIVSERAGELKEAILRLTAESRRMAAESGMRDGG